MWQRISRVGTPKVRPRSQQSNEIEITVQTAPRYPEGWQDYFDTKIKELGVKASYNSSVRDQNGIYSYSDSADLEHVVETIDVAVEFANDQYEAEVVPRIEAERQRVVDEAALVTARQTELDERAAKLAKPAH